MILDATAGNRTMWRFKNCGHIIYIDIERKLQVKPTIICSNEQTPFLSNTFNTIFYDPPHMWADKSSYFIFKNTESFLKKWKGYGKIPRYYGGDKYSTRHKLLKHIYNAQKEFNRILTDDGLLWLKWNETRIRINKLLTVFTNWTELLRLPIYTPTRVVGTYKTYWVCLCKKERKVRESDLSEF